jgi:nucleoside-diphosphate-sugar epimerase
MKILITGGNGNIAKMINKNLSNKYEIVNLSRTDLNVLSFEEVKKYIENNNFDILVHTAILGGRRTKEENGDVTHKNLLMLENLLYFADRFKMIINFDSAAIYDRNTDILNRKEEDLSTIPTDYYGFSKYVIYKRTLQYENVFNFRIFNIFHPNEEEDRFMKQCFIAKKKNTIVNIFEDKWFDFVYENDFIKIIDFYFSNINNKNNLEKTINICYKEKYKLSDIAKLIVNKSNINVLNKNSSNNYSGNGEKLNKLGLELIGLNKSLTLYNDVFFHS